MNYTKLKKVEIIEPIHFIGIGGSGMRPLAELCVNLGIEFSGSDIKTSSFTTSLEKTAKIYIGHKKENIADCKTIVVSSAIDESNPEIVEAKAKGIQIAHRSDLLNYFLKMKKSIAVAGTHGKTSTSAMITHMLSELNLMPTSIVGGELINSNTFSLHGDGEYIVAEADESDGSFLKYQPYYSIITNIDKDHLDFYGDLDGAINAFREFANNTNKDGSTLICWDNEYCRNLRDDINGDFLSFGFSLGSDVRCLDYKHTENGMYIKIHAIYNTIEGHVPLIGRHNVLNILSCIALAIKLKIPPKEALEAMSNYKGVMRRTETIYSKSGLTIIDDYAHNPGKIAAVIKSLKQAYPETDLWVLFENHRYSRLQSMYDDIINSLEGSDRVFVAPIFAAGEAIDEKYTPRSISEDIKNILQINAEPYFNDKIVKSLISNTEKRPTILLTVGAGMARSYGMNIRDQLYGKERQ